MKYNVRRIEGFYGANLDRIQITDLRDTAKKILVYQGIVRSEEHYKELVSKYCL